VGFFDDISSGKNKIVYKPITQDKIYQAMMSIANNTPKLPKNREIVIMTGRGGMKKINDAIFEETIREILLTKLSEAYLEGKFTAKQYTKVEKLLHSKNYENVKFAVKLLQTKTDLDIRILTKYK